MSLMKKLSFRAMSPRKNTASKNANSSGDVDKARNRTGDFQLGYKLAMETDIGGMRENQDDGFIWRHAESSSIVLAVLDGHGSDLGAFASQQGRLAMIAWLDEHFTEILENPAVALRNLFASTQERMFAMYQNILQRGGYEVEVQNGYLVKRKGGPESPWLCVHGGSSCSVVVFANGGRKMYTANVGDSSGIMAVNGKMLSMRMLKPLYEENEPEEMKFTDAQLNSNPSSTIEITWDHSPECPREFRRMRMKKPDEATPTKPHLMIVYDSPSRKKFQCPNVFNVDGNGVPTVTNNGKYYKNVRREWASLITTPPSARFHDALAFTRSLGDFHLQSCGITCNPDVFEFDIEGLFNGEDAAPTKSVGESTIGCIVLCSDGVWDNWQYDDVTNFFLESSKISKVSHADSAEEQTREFMESNQQKAQTHFGNDADNATAIVCYFSPTFSS